MIRDLDIYRSANVLIREHGEDAALDATTWAISEIRKADVVQLLDYVEDAVRTWAER